MPPLKYHFKLTNNQLPFSDKRFPLGRVLLSLFCKISYFRPVIPWFAVEVLGNRCRISKSIKFGWNLLLGFHVVLIFQQTHPPLQSSHAGSASIGSSGSGSVGGVSSKSTEDSMGLQPVQRLLKRTVHKPEKMTSDKGKSGHIYFTFHLTKVKKNKRIRKVIKFHTAYLSIYTGLSRFIIENVFVDKAHHPSQASTWVAICDYTRILNFYNKFNLLKFF